MEQPETIERVDTTEPTRLFFGPLFSPLLYLTPEQLRDQNTMLAQVITAQDERIAGLLAERAELFCLLGLRGEVAALEQAIEERDGGPCR